ncbi:hypothetical protein [Neisseria musculi]|uniref:hypothetical protein n=1 Tax=Neisseria musculi TaxID=1815583 RepID=UPI001072D26C|nr:hypothetical protein [Neisseria musculi]MBF0804456.1 hypothetical protein [Neisseria sp. 19428wB4_WF04]TFU42779.1 hypothetical protein E4T99_08890 [Neisseria sp. WF04]
MAEREMMDREPEPAKRRAGTGKAGGRRRFGERQHGNTAVCAYRAPYPAGGRNVHLIYMLCWRAGVSFIQQGKNTV